MSLKRLLAGAGASLALSLVSVGTASAVVQRPFIDSFGLDGTAATFFQDEQKVGFDQANQRLYVDPMWTGNGIQAYDMSPPGNHTHLGAPYPLAGGGGAYVAGIAVDNSSTATAGRVYAPHGNLEGWNPDTTPLTTPFPVSPPNSRFCNAAVDSHGNVAVTNINEVGHDEEGRGVTRFSPLGVELNPVDIAKFQLGTACGLDFDSHDNLFVSAETLRKYTASSNYTQSTEFGDNSGIQLGSVTIDHSNDHVLISNGDTVAEYAPDGSLIRRFGKAFGIHYAGFQNVAINEATDEVYVADAGTGNHVEVFGPPILLPTTTSNRPKEVTTTSAQLFGKVDPDGGSDVTDCFFEWGTDNGYFGGTVPCDPEVTTGDPIDSPEEVTTELTGLSAGTQYHYRLVTENSNGTNAGEDQTLIAQFPPTISEEKILEVTSDASQLTAQVNPTGVPTHYFYEYGPEDCAVSTCLKTDEVDIEGQNKKKTSPAELVGLTPGTEYHFRVVAVNDQNGIRYGKDNTFRTFALDPSGVDPCPNAHERKQTGAAKLPHCRAYELVSAIDSGGYNVTSNLVPGEAPMPAYPGADDRFLYTMSSGRVPGVSGFPTNFPGDPYVAKRTAAGWVTSYVGLPASGTPSAAPFASELSGADGALDTFAFGEPNRCSPCFEDGSTGIPLRLPNGSLVQGMAGSIPAADPQAGGDIAKPFSADGSAFLFGSTTKLESAGNSGSLSIYERDLNAGTTQVVSTMPDGTTMSGDVDELDVSVDGDRVLVGRPVGADAAGNALYDLYMHIGSSPNSIAVADTVAGVLYDGMSDDGSKVYFSTDQAMAGDADTSADIFRADVGAGSATLSRVSTGSGGTGDVDSCTPPDNWNVPSGGADCSALAFAGGAGVAAGDGSIYFLSPELLDGGGNGLPNQPNIYVNRPGSATKFVGVLDNSTVKPPPPPPKHPLLNIKFGGGLNEPHNLAVDQSNGDVYVLENGGVSRFDSTGAPHKFTAGGGVGTNKIPQGSIGGFAEWGMDVDNDPSSPLYRSIYVAEPGGKVNVYAPSGEKIGEIASPGYVCGVAVDPTTGVLYMSDYYGPKIFRFVPNSPSGTITEADYEAPTSITAQGINPCQVAADGAGHVYASNWSSGPLRQYDISEFAAVPPSLGGKELSGSSQAMSVDPVRHELYVDEGSQIRVFSSSGVPGAVFGVGQLGGSFGIAVNGNTRHAYATNGNSVREFGYEDLPYKVIDHPAIGHAINQSAVHNAADFQVTPNGDQAVFTSLVEQGDGPTYGFLQVYRYDAPSGDLDCASCPRSGVNGTGSASLAPAGLNIADDGRVFFTTPDQLTLRDTNRRADAYEWDEGGVRLVSPGNSLTDTALASVDASGKNAYFFTRDPLAHQDENGSTMKVYTAREGGGFAFLPDEVPCQASDECHGPSSEAPSPPPIGTYKGTGGNEPAATTPAATQCRKGFVKKHGKCVKKKPHKKKGNRRGHRRHHRG